MDIDLQHLCFYSGLALDLSDHLHEPTTKNIDHNVDQPLSSRNFVHNLTAPTVGSRPLRPLSPEHDSCSPPAVQLHAGRCGVLPAGVVYPTVWVRACRRTIGRAPPNTRPSVINSAATSVINSAVTVRHQLCRNCSSLSVISFRQAVPAARRCSSSSRRCSSSPSRRFSSPSRRCSSSSSRRERRTMLFRAGAADNVIQSGSNG